MKIMTTKKRIFGQVYRNYFITKVAMESKGDLYYDGLFSRVHNFRGI